MRVGTTDTVQGAGASAVGIDADGEHATRLAQGVLDGSRGGGTGENEPEVAIALGHGYEPSPTRDGDVHPHDARDGPDLGFAVDAHQGAGGGDGNHEHPGGTPSRRHGVRPAQGVGEHEGLEAATGTDAQGSGTQAPDGAGRDLEDHGTLPAYTQLG